MTEQIVANGQVSNPGASLRSASGSPEPARVLVVDDERGLRELLQYGLEQAGFSVRTVADGPAAFPVLQAWGPDVIVLDVMLPGPDGLTLLPEIRGLTTAPVVMLTARTELDEKLAGFSAG